MKTSDETRRGDSSRAEAWLKFDTDAMVVFYNGKTETAQIRTKIRFFYEKQEGTIEGFVTDGTNPVPDAKVNFLYEGRYISRSTTTDQNGYYTANLPTGRYSVAAYANSYYASFSGQKSEPYSANIITLTQNEVQTVNISLTGAINNGIRVSGRVLDSLSTTALRKAIVISPGDA